MNKKTANQTVAEAAAQKMPPPFARGRENDAEITHRLAAASPAVADVKRRADEARAEAARILSEADAAVVERANQIEQLRSLLADERVAVSALRTFSGKEAEVLADIELVERRLTESAIVPAMFSYWPLGIEKLCKLRVEREQAARVLPAIRQHHEQVIEQRAELQRRLGFAVAGINVETGQLDGAEPEAPPLRFEWQQDSAGGLARLRPVGAAEPVA